MQPEAGVRSSRHGAVLSAGLFRDNAIASTEAEYRRRPMLRGDKTLVRSFLKGLEIVKVMKEALEASRNMVRGKGIGLNSTIISVKSKEGSNVEFAITINIEHGGEKVIMSGNVGGEYKEHKLRSNQKISDDWIARSTAGLYWIAGGTEDGELEISFTEE